MMNYQVIKPSEQLAPYVDDFVAVTGDQLVSKTVTPKTGASLTFDFHNTNALNGNRFNVSLVGLHDRQFYLEGVHPSHDTFMVELSPIGLATLSGNASDVLFNRIVDASEFFGQEVNTLYKRLRDTSLEERMETIESFLLRKIQAPSASDRMVFDLAENIRAEPNFFTFADLKSTTPLGLRQIERRFRHVSGTNIQTYLRIARFEKAKALLRSGESVRLTDIGYAAGYSDQAHFSTDFKRLAGRPPKTYTFCGSIDAASL